MKTAGVVFFVFMASVVTPWPAASQPIPYEFDLSTGAFPAGTEIENVSGILPDRSAYKHGYTEKGWTIDRIDNKGYAALSPTYSSEEEPCANVLRLPEMEIREGCFLRWEARSVYRHFPESYRVEAFTEEGKDPILLYETTGAPWSWEQQQVSLEGLEGKHVRIVFTCTSSGGYMLALCGIGIAEGPLEESDESSDSQVEEFTRALVVDDATGMWCVNCPEGETALNGLRDKYGSRLITLSTHVNDALANPDYWSRLSWYSVPRMMLNRIRASEGANTKNFGDYYDCGTPFSVETLLPEKEDETMLKLTAHVKVSEVVENEADRYRVGFVVTGDFHRPDDVRFRQKNNCTQPLYGAYYFLPSEIPSALMFYDHVTLTSETAFSGIEDSLPAELVPGEEYEVVWRCVRPSILEGEEEPGAVALVLDTRTGEIMNASVGTDSEFSTVKDIERSYDLSPLITGIGKGWISSSLMDGEEYTLEVFSAEGLLIYSCSGVATGKDVFRLPSWKGMATVSLITSGKSQTIKLIL